MRSGRPTLRPPPRSTWRPCPSRRVRRSGSPTRTESGRRSHSWGMWRRRISRGWRISSRSWEDEAFEEFWRHQARILAVFATPASLRSFRLPNRLTPVAIGGTQFFVKPLLRAVTFPQTAFVLALAQGSVRLLETVPDTPPREVRVPDMPTDVASAVGKSSIKDRAPIRRVQGAEGQKLRMAQFSRLVDGALREVLPGHGVPLVLAATEPLDSIFRAHCRYPDLVPISVPGNPEGRGDGELVADARSEER